MNIPSNIAFAAVIALAISISIACSSFDATPVSNETANQTVIAATTSPATTDEPKRQMAVAPTIANRSRASAADVNLSDDQRWCLAWALDNL